MTGHAVVLAADSGDFFGRLREVSNHFEYFNFGFVDRFILSGYGPIKGEYFGYYIKAILFI